MTRILGLRSALHAILAGLLCASYCASASGQPILNLSTTYAGLQLDDKGFIVSLTSKESGKQYSPAGHPSPLMSLHEYGQPYSQLLEPASAVFHRDNQEIELRYSNGAVAFVKADAKASYLRFQLISLAPRGTVDNIAWGPLHTTVIKKIGDIIGVVRDDNWAIGMLGLDDNTIAGPPADGDCYSMGYLIHTPDPVKYPVPPQLKGGQWFSVGGNGVSDTSFNSHSEPYFFYVMGNGAYPEPGFGSSVCYHARDRRKSYTYLYSLLPGFPASRPRHQVSDPVDGVDFIGSAVALYACPDDLGLSTIEKITLGEALPHPMVHGKWIRDSTAYSPTVYWNGPYDKCIEYTKALGLTDISRDTGEFYPCLGNNWGAGNVGFANGKGESFKDFSERAHEQGLTNGGLHTLCVFLQGGVSNDVTPVPSERLQTVLRTKLAKDVSATDMDVVVTDPSFLAEKGTYPLNDNSNYLRIGGEMMRYESISDTAPWTIKISKRGHASTAMPHKAGDELVKLQQNCYNGFLPDMTRLRDYADYYADLMVRNGMDTINFDGFESTVELVQGYYGTRVFCRRLFETYSKLTGGKVPRVSASCVFSGAWEYLNVCDLGGGANMFNVFTGRRAIEGKDIGNGFTNSYFPGTFGIQGWNSAWSLYDAENLQAKAVGWDSTYALAVGQDAIDRTGERDTIFPAFRAWQAARAAGLFTKALKEQLKDPDFKYHLEQTGDNSFVLYPIKEIHVGDSAGTDAKPVAISNSQNAQPMQFALQVNATANGCVITLPNGFQIKTDARLESGQFIVCKGSHAYIGDKFRKKIADLAMSGAAGLPMGESKIGVQFPSKDAAKVPFSLTVWIAGTGERIGI